MSEKELKTYRASATDRQRKYKSKKKQLQVKENFKKSSTFMVKKTVCKSSQSMGKAML